MNKLYRRNNNGAPTVWWAELDSGTNSITVFYGLVRGNIHKEFYAVTQKDGQKEAPRCRWRCSPIPRFPARAAAAQPPQ